MFITGRIVLTTTHCSICLSGGITIVMTGHVTTTPADSAVVVVDIGYWLCGITIIAGPASGNGGIFGGSGVIPATTDRRRNCRSAMLL